jgi:cell division protein FtsB
LLREVKRRLRLAIAPALFIAITAYFAWNAAHGSRGLEAQRVQRQVLASAQASLAREDAKRQQWDLRVAALQQSAIQPDALDEAARHLLNLADPADLVVPLPETATDPNGAAGQAADGGPPAGGAH